jgi:hypothetical protein
MEIPTRTSENRFSGHGDKLNEFFRGGTRTCLTSDDSPVAAEHKVLQSSIYRSRAYGG